MTILLFLPDLPFDIENVSVGIKIAAALIGAFLVLALGFSIYQSFRMRGRMKRLDEEISGRHSRDLPLEEQLCGVGSSASSRSASRQKKDPWRD
jgi:hypothetical protein